MAFIAAPVGFAITVASVSVGILIEKGIEMLLGIFDKRSVDWDNVGGSRILYQWNTTNLRGKDMAMLHGLNMKMIDANTAVFKTDQFEVNGSASIVHQDAANEDGFIHGQVNFVVPGLDEPVEGTFVTVNPTSGNEEAKANLDKVSNYVEQGREMQKNQAMPELGEAVQQYAPLVEW